MNDAARLLLRPLLCAALGAALCGATPAQTCLTANYDQTVSNKVGQSGRFGILVNTGNQARTIRAVDFYLRAIKQPRVVTVHLFTRSTMGSKPPALRLTSAKRTVGLSNAHARFTFQPPVTLPPNFDFFLMIDNPVHSQMFMPIATSGTRITQYFRFTNQTKWFGPAAVNYWNYRIHCICTTDHYPAPAGCYRGSSNQLLPSLTPSKKPVLGTTVRYTVQGAVPKSSVFVFLGNEPTGIRIAGSPATVPCILGTFPIFVWPATASTAGTASVDIPYPNVAALKCVMAYIQAANVHPSIPWGWHVTDLEAALMGL